jgi:hypothetical protein
VAQAVGENSRSGVIFSDRRRPRPGSSGGQFAAAQGPSRDTSAAACVDGVSGETGLENMPSHAGALATGLTRLGPAALTMPCLLADRRQEPQLANTGPRLGRISLGRDGSR